MIAIALALQLLADPVPAGGMPGATPDAPGMPRFVQLASLTGVPPDSTERAGFVSAFRGTFAEPELPGERLASWGEWKSGLPLPNRFRLLEGSEAEDAWQLEVQIGAPPPVLARRTERQKDGKGKWHDVTVTRANVRRRASRGMVVAYTVRIPDPSGAVGRTIKGRTAFYFPLPGGDGTSPAVPAMYDYSWSEAGRIAATLVLEALQRESRDLLERERMDVAPALRTDPTADSGGSR